MPDSLPDSHDSGPSSNGRAKSTTAMWMGLDSMTRWADRADAATWEWTPMGSRMRGRRLTQGSGCQPAAERRRLSLPPGTGAPPPLDWPDEIGGSGWRVARRMSVRDMATGVPNHVGLVEAPAARTGPGARNSRVFCCQRRELGVWRVPMWQEVRETSRVGGREHGLL